MNSTSYWEEVQFSEHGDDRGSLIAIEKRNGLPFDVKRVYCIYGTKHGVTRGYHAHRNLDQILIALSGSCRVLVDNGKKNESVMLNDPTKGLRIRNLIWREMSDFSDDCVLLVLASEQYDESDYIRNYNTFLEAISKNL